MFPDLTQSVIGPVVLEARGNIEQAVLTLRTFQGDPIQDQRRAAAALSEADKLRAMRDALGTAFDDATLRRALQDARGDVNLAINELFSTSQLPALRPVQPTPAPAPQPTPPPPVPTKPKPLDDFRVEDAVRREQEEALRRAREAMAKQQAPKPVATDQTKQLEEDLKRQREEMAQRARAEREREEMLERNVAELGKRLLEAEARLKTAQQEAAQAERQRITESTVTKIAARAQAEVLDRERRALAEKDLVARQLDETRAKLAEL
jgi:hypothetical protein